MLARTATSPDVIAESLKEEIFEGNSVVNPQFKELKDQDKLNELSMLLTDHRHDDEENETEIEAYTGNGITVAWNPKNTDSMVFELPNMFLVKDSNGWDSY